MYYFYCRSSLNAAISQLIVLGTIRDFLETFRDEKSRHLEFSRNMKIVQDTVRYGLYLWIRF